MNLERIKIECQKLAHAGAVDEDLLNFLRREGCSKAASIFVISQVKEINMGEAKTMVHFSHTWADQKSSDESWQEELDKQIQKDRPKQN